MSNWLNDLLYATKVGDMIELRWKILSDRSWTKAVHLNLVRTLERSSATDEEIHLPYFVCLYVSAKF